MTFDDIATGGDNMAFWPGNPALKFPFSPFTPGSLNAAKGAALAHGEAEIAKREAAAGRVLSANEHRRGTVERPDSRNAIQRQADANWKPELQKPRQYDALAESFKPSVNDKAFTGKTRAERLYASVRQLQDGLDDTAERDAELAQHLAEPRTATALAELNRIRSLYQWDPSIPMEQWLSVERAIQQVSHPQGDTTKAREMVGEVLFREDARIASQRAAAEQTLAVAQQRVAELQAAMPEGGSDAGTASE